MSIRVGDYSTNIYCISDHLSLLIDSLEIKIARNLVCLAATLLCNSNRFEYWGSKSSDSSNVQVEVTTWVYRFLNLDFVRCIDCQPCLHCSFNFSTLTSAILIQSPSDCTSTRVSVSKIICNSCTRFNG
jgi:hypothetical protein